MKSLNLVQLIGNLGGDPECTEHEGKMVSKFSIALDEEWLDKTTNQRRGNIEWQKLVCFNKLGEIAKNHLKKGARVYVSGKLKTSKWVDKNEVTQYRTEVIVNELIMLDSKESSTKEAE